VIAEPAHRLGLPLDARPRVFVQLLGLDPGKRDVSVQHRVVGQVHLFPAPLAEEPFDLVPSAGKCRGLGQFCWRGKLSRGLN